MEGEGLRVHKYVERFLQMCIMFLRSKRVRLTINDHGHLAEVTEFARVGVEGMMTHPQGYHQRVSGASWPPRYPGHLNSPKIRKFIL